MKIFLDTNDSIEIINTNEAEDRVIIKNNDLVGLVVKDDII